MIDFRLDDQRVLVTAARTGLGAAIADGLASLGAQIVATSRDHDHATELGNRYGTEPCVLDVRDIASVRDALNRVWQRGPIDVVVNNAGVNHPQPVLDVDEAHWDDVVDTNLKGMFFVSQTFARLAGVVASDNGQDADRPTQGRAIVNIGSQAGFVALPQRAAYGASKGGVVQLTRTLAIDLAPNIRVNAVAPTYIDTEMTRTTLAEPSGRADILARIPLGRLAEPSDVAGAVAFLAGPMAAMVTGHTLLVDGGWTAQ